MSARAEACSPPGATVRPVVEDQRDAPSTVRRLRRARAGRRLVLAALGLFVLAGLVNLLGVRTSTARDEAGGYRLEVRYPSIARPGLGVVWQVEVVREGGFEGPVEVAVEAGYFAMFDENGLEPAPDAEVSAGDMIIWTFEQPEGDRLLIDFDARVAPTWTLTKRGSVEVREGHAVVATVSFQTWNLP